MLKTMDIPYNLRQASGNHDESFVSQHLFTEDGKVKDENEQMKLIFVAASLQAGGIDGGNRSRVDQALAAGAPKRADKKQIPMD